MGKPIQHKRLYNALEGLSVEGAEFARRISASLTQLIHDYQEEGYSLNDIELAIIHTAELDMEERRIRRMARANAGIKWGDKRKQ